MSKTTFSTIFICIVLVVCPSHATPTNEEPLLPVEQVTAFSKAFSYIKELYVDDVTDEQLLEGAIRGMLQSLDPHSTYLDKNAMQAIQQSTTGSYGGLGIEVDSAGELVTIVTPLDGSPADKAGIKAGDKIIMLDKKSVVGINTREVVEMLKGDIGTAIEITVQRAHVEKPLSFNVTRDLIKLNSVDSKWLTDNIAYIRISQFNSETHLDVKQALMHFIDHPSKNLHGLILDLRNNPGGLLDSAVAISDEFLESGLIVSTKSRSFADEEYFANPGDSLKGKPIIIMVNNGSASASEIVAGALRDNHRGIILGNQTFGKGSVQTIKPLTTQTAMKLTISRYYAPSGQAIQNKGLTPDIEVPEVQVASVEHDKQTREQDLLNSLPADSTETEASQHDASTDEKLIQLLHDDYQLYQAITVLKGIQTFAQY